MIVSFQTNETAANWLTKPIPWELALPVVPINSSCMISDYVSGQSSVEFKESGGNRSLTLRWLARLRSDKEPLKLMENSLRLMAIRTFYLSFLVSVDFIPYLENCFTKFISQHSMTTFCNLLVFCIIFFPKELRPANLLAYAERYMLLRYRPLS